MRYFAYGSNMDVNRVRERGLVYDSIRPAKLKGFALRFNKVSKKDPKMGFANIVPEVGSEVEGVLYRVSDKKSMLKLDKFE